MSKVIRRWYRRVKARVNRFPKSRRRTIGIAVAGLGLIGAGIIMLVLPGPGVLVIAIGLAILSVEFVWAQMIVRQLRHALVFARRRSRGKRWFPRRLRAGPRLDSAPG